MMYGLIKPVHTSLPDRILVATAHRRDVFDPVHDEVTGVTKRAFCHINLRLLRA
jgi:hypothetical protein